LKIACVSADGGWGDELLLDDLQQSRRNNGRRVYRESSGVVANIENGRSLGQAIQARCSQSSSKPFLWLELKQLKGRRISPPVYFPNKLATIASKVLELRTAITAEP
jgi:hypothetical protein